MKDKSWIIIAMMGLALIISISYSVVVSQRKANAEKTVTTKSIIEMTATTATIKNTLTGKGAVTYKEKEINQNIETQNITTEDKNNVEQDKQEIMENNSNENSEIETTNDNQDLKKTYQITLSIEDKDVKKVRINQDVEITIKKEERELNYIGKVIKIKEAQNNKSTLDVEITNPDENIEENQIATCTVIIEKAENAIALPIEAIQKDEEQKTYVDLVIEDGTTIKSYIKTGISDDYYVEITEGLNVGDRVQIVKSSTTVINGNETNSLSNISSGK